tara:strand:+ start:57 stop:239 length:183 start_codon:yes stop_codon:yes gene_type:complete
MYVSKKDIDTIAELSAFVDGAVESADGKDDNGNDIADYWLDFSDRVDKLQQKMNRQHCRQ